MPYTAGMPRRIELSLLLAILLIAAFFRFHLITELPPGLYPDEAVNGNNALEAIRNFDSSTFRHSVKVFYPENNGREGLFINLQAVAIKFLGSEPWVLRMVSAVFGTLTVFGLYLLAKELFRPNPKPEALNPTQALNPNDQNRAPFRNSGFGFRVSRGESIALLSSFLLATSFWHINFSRIGFRAVMVPFFAVFALYWLFKAIRTGKLSSAVAGGIVSGLGFHSYIAFRFMPFVMAVPVGMALAQWRNARRSPSASSGTDTRPRLPCLPCVTAVGLLAAIIVALPIGLYFLQHPADFFGRGNQVSIFSAASPSKEFVKSTALTLGMFNLRGDCNARHNLACQPQLFWPLGLLFLIGAAHTIRALFRKPVSPVPYTLSAWFAMLMLPAVLTREGLPHALRSIGLIPPVMILAAIGAGELWRTVTGYLEAALANPRYAPYRSQLRRIKGELAVAAILVLVWIPAATYRDYFMRFAVAPATADAFAADLLKQGRYLARLPDDVQKFVVVNLSGDDIRGLPAPAQTIMFATDTFDASRRRARNLTYVTRAEDITAHPGASIAIILMSPRDRAAAAALKRRFPDLRLQVRGDVLVFERFQ